MNVEKILQISTDDIMSLLELKEDPMFTKMSKEEIIYYINSSKDIAREKARIFKQQYGDESLINICKDKNIKVNICDKEYRVMDIRYRAEICYTQNEINIIKPSIEFMFNQLKNNDLKIYRDKTLEIENVIDIHMAHELYHFLEYKDGKDTGDLLPKLTRFKVFNLKKTSKIVRASEIAAHIFCKEYLGLPFHPKVLDYLYLINSGEIREEDFFNYIDKQKTEFQM